MIRLNHILAVAAATLGLGAFAPAAHAQAQGACAGDGAISYVCGPLNVEDMALAPETPWLIASGMAGPGHPAGQLYLIDVEHDVFKPLTPDVSGPAKAPYAACPGPLDLAKLAPHGLAVRRGHWGLHTLYLVNHGGRESIEIFDIDVKSGEPKLTWIGCVVLPAGASGNAVAPLPDDGFVATRFQTAGDAKSFEKMTRLEKDGLLYEWSPKTGFKVIPDSQMSGANGVEASPDGKWIYANAWPEQRVIRFDRGGGSKPVSVKLDFLPDNIRWAPDGKLLVGGQDGDIKTLIGCDKPRCWHGWSVVKLDPVTMKVTPVLHHEGAPDVFADATVGVQVGRELWVGTYRGDRVVHTPAPDLP